MIENMQEYLRLITFVFYILSITLLSVIFIFNIRYKHMQAIYLKLE